MPQLVMYGNPSNFYNNPAKIDSDIQTFIVGHGFNGFHVSVYCRWFDLDKEDCVSTVGSNPNIDPRTFDALEDLITKTYAAGGMVHIWMWGDGNNNPSVRLDWGGLNGSVEMNLLQEIANRLGPLPGWTMGYGFDVTEWSSETEATVWHDSLQSFFPQAHSLGARADGPNTGTNHSPFISWNQGFDYSSTSTTSQLMMFTRLRWTLCLASRLCLKTVFGFATHLIPKITLLMKLAKVCGIQLWRVE